ncbi:MAG: hypothetical protein AB7N71_06695 [Phycisphaerae bacterium]
MKSHRRNVTGKVLATFLAAVLFSTLSGCQFMKLIAIFGKPPTKLVKAEWPHLAGKKVSIVVWAEMDTLFEYPYIQLEISRHIEDALQPNVSDITIVSPRDVVKMQQNDPDWDRKAPTFLGEQFDADNVLFIELTQYTTREPDSPHLFRGHIAANLKVYDVGFPNAAPLYRDNVEAMYPPESAGQYGTDDIAIRKMTLEVFATEVANKFYDRKVKVE